MDKQKAWFPEFGLLKIIYNKNSIVHGIDHILRVWIYAQLISKNFEGQIDKDVLSAAALLHDVGRKNDFTDKDHGKLSAKWVKEFLPIITTDFTNEQVEKIAFLCAKHNKDDFENEPIELQILKDADALDRKRLPMGKLKIELLRTYPAKNLVGFANKFFDKWKFISFFKKNIEEVFSESLRYFVETKVLIDLEINKQEKNIRISDIRNVEKELKKWEVLKYKLQKLTEEGTLSDRIFKEIYRLNSVRENLKLKNKTLKNILKWQSCKYLRQGLRLSLNDHTYKKSIQEVIKNLYKDAYFETKRIPEISLSEIFQILLFERQIKITQIKNCLLNNLSINKQISEIIIFTGLIRNHYYQLIQNSFLKEKDPTHFIPVQFPLEDIKRNTDLWILLVDRWIEKSLGGEIGYVKALYLGEYSISFIRMIFDNIFLTSHQCDLLTKSLIKAINLSNQNKFNLNLSKIKNIFGRNFTTIGIIKFEGCTISKFANVFNLYDDVEDENIKECCKSQVELIKILKDNNVDIKNIVKNYIIPMANIKVFQAQPLLIKYFPDIKIPEFLKNKNYLLKFEKHNEYQNFIKNVKEYSEENYKFILEKLNYKEDLKKDDLEEMRVIMNILDLKILQNIIEGSQQILPIQNIINKKNFKLFSAFKKTDYFQRTEYRDIVQRSMGIRLPNQRGDTPIYGSLENVPFLLRDKNLREALKIQNLQLILGETLQSKRYGNVILVFKKEIRDRSIFVFFDSLWEFRKKPIALEEAIKLRKIIKENPIITSLKTHPLSYPAAYIEAIIMGGATLNDVEKVIVPKKEFEKEQYLIKKIKKTYPQIEFIAV